VVESVGMNIKVNLRGWADGLSDNPRKIYFPLQCAMYEVIGDCDWNFEVKAEGEFVYNPWKISVKAKRCHSKDIDMVKNTEKSNFTYREFSFEVPQFTVAYIYEGAVKELRRTRIKNA
jgi:hypothetical protein